MTEQMRVSRGKFLKLTAMAAVGTAVAAVVDVGVPAAEAQTAYNEAPMLAGQVAAGALPPVDQRLPANPYTPPHKWLSTGKYGGTLRLTMQYPGDIDNARRISNYMYGHSPVRWLRDGLEIGPGLAESWESSPDASVWVFHFRQGLKWSDGQPWTVDDIMFWWEDEVKVDALKELPPDETRSGNNTLAQFTKIDDYTLQLTFDSPAPLTVDRTAMWVKRDPAGGGGRWMDPKHYLAQFHIKYNASLNPSTWQDNYLKMREHRTNPDCPVMTGWMLESIVPGQSQTYVRNPYYWAVDKAGNQLPYLDRISAKIFQDPEVMKLQVTNGEADYLQGNQAPFTLSDVQTLRGAEARSGMELRFWDNGGGTGVTYFFNYNDQRPQWRALVRNSTFLKALSMAFDRAQIQKAVYFGTGEITTGTMSPKAIEYNIPGGAGVYQEWRDSASKFDPETAKKMLDSIGVRDVNGDGFREFPDGSPLEITLDYSGPDNAATSDVVRKNEFMAKDWNAVGLKTTLNPLPLPGNAFYDAWEGGKLLMNAQWGVGDGPNHLVYPQWVVPLERQRWAPLNGNWYSVRGTPKEGTELDKAPLDRQPPREGPEPGDPVDRLWQIYDKTKTTVDPLDRHKLVWDIVKIHVNDGPFFTGSVANAPRIILVKKGLLNVPKRDDLALGGFVDPWIHPTPAVYDPETWYWDNPAQH